MPMRMMAPLPYCFSIWASANSSALSFSLRSSFPGALRATISAITMPSHPLGPHTYESERRARLRDPMGDVNSDPSRGLIHVAPAVRRDGTAGQPLFYLRVDRSRQLSLSFHPIVPTIRGLPERTLQRLRRPGSARNRYPPRDHARLRVTTCHHPSGGGSRVTIVGWHRHQRLPWRVRLRLHASQSCALVGRSDRRGRLCFAGPPLWHDRPFIHHSSPKRDAASGKQN